MILNDKLNFLSLPKVSFSQDIDGFLSGREGRLLYYLASRCQRETSVVEIGSWKGKSTIWLAEGSRAGASVPIFAIDPHTGSAEHQSDTEKVWTFEVFKNNIEKKGVKDLITPILKTSQEACAGFGNPIGFLFIDGAHEYEFVALDYKLWAPMVTNGGWIAFHDVQWQGVTQTIKEVLPLKQLKNMYFTDYLLCAQKSDHVNLWDQIKNWLMFSVSLNYAWTKDSHLPKPISTFWKNILKFFRAVVYLL